MSNNHDEYMDKLKKVKLDPSRKNLNPFPDNYTLEQMIVASIIEGNELLKLDEKKKKTPNLPSAPQNKKVLTDTLGKMSSNPYTRARTQVLRTMTSEKRTVIEKMENGTLDKDSRWDTFCKEIRILGDKLSGNN